MNLVFTVLLCSHLQSAMFSLYRVEVGQVRTPDFGISEVCSFAYESGSDDLRKMCDQYDQNKCVEGE